MGLGVWERRDDSWELPGATKKWLKNEMNNALTSVVIYMSIMVVMSVVCFAVYGLDKRRAVNGGRRIPERTLHILAFLGGWPGAMLGQSQFRHKTQKLPFLIVFWFVVIFHIAIVGTATYLLLGSSASDRNTVQRAIFESPVVSVYVAIGLIGWKTSDEFANPKMRPTTRHKSLARKLTVLEPH